MANRYAHPQDSNPFADANPFIDPPNHYLTSSHASPLLYRNKSERDRLQGIQQTSVKPESTNSIEKPRTFGQKIDLWMINEGGKRLFFFTWILFHCLVVAFGFLNYQLSDDFSHARASYGVTYGVYPLAFRRGKTRLMFC